MLAPARDGEVRHGYEYMDRDECPGYKQKLPASELRGTLLTPFVKTLRLKRELVRVPEHFQQGVPHFGKRKHTSCKRSVLARTYANALVSFRTASSV